MSAHPKLFRELSEPFPTMDALTAALDAFTKDLGEIREKHRIANVYCVLAFSVIENGEETESMSSVSFGDSLRRQPMAAWAYGREQADHEALMRHIVAEALRRGRQ